MTAVMYAFEYLFSIPIFGLIFYILNKILVGIAPIATPGVLTDLADHLWIIAVIIYIIFGIFWLPRKINERNEWGN